MVATLNQFLSTAKVCCYCNRVNSELPNNKAN